MPEIYYVKKAFPLKNEIGAIIMEYLGDSKTLGMHMPLDIPKVGFIWKFLSAN